MTEPRLSSTVILVRQGSVAPEFLLVERATGGAFSGAHVFPGGVLERSDFAAVNGNLSEVDARSCLELADGALAFFSAAVRELFEETAILLATPRLSPDVRLQAREALLTGAHSWSSLLSELGLTLDFQALRYVSFWVTPKTLPKRFATRFFLAVNTDAQNAVACGQEIRSCQWLSAGQALANAETGLIKLAPPTQLTLMDLQIHAHVEAVTDWANQRQSTGVVCIEPDSANAGAIRNAAGSRA